MPPRIKQTAAKLDKEINLFEPGQKLVGIDIGSNMVKIAVLKDSPVGTRLISLALAEVFPPNKQTEENPEKKISMAIKNALEQLRTNVKHVCTFINVPSLQIKNITLPSMPNEELKESVKWEMEQNINFPIDEATIDFLISGETIRSGAKNLELEVAAAKTEEIRNFIETYKQNHLSIQSINIPSFCLWNVFQKSNQWKETDTIALIDIGAKITKINIFNNNILRFSREIFFGGETITQTLAKEMNISLQEAEEVKIKYGMGDNSPYYEKISETAKQLASDIDRSFSYYKAQFHIESINRLILYGGTSKLINLDKFLSETLGLFVEVGNPFNGLLFDQKSFGNFDEFVPFFTTAIGAALTGGGAKRINLLPFEFRKDTKKEVKKLLLKFSSITILFAFIFTYINVINKEKKLSREKVEQEEIIAVWQDEQEFEKKFAFLNSIHATQESWINILKGISSVIPEGVWLDSITLEEASKLLVLQGASESNILVMEFVRKLKTLPYFNNINLESIKEKEEGSKPFIYFKITGLKK